MNTQPLEKRTIVYLVSKIIPVIEFSVYFVRIQIHSNYFITSDFSFMTDK